MPVHELPPALTRRVLLLHLSFLTVSLRNENLLHQLRLLGRQGIGPVKAIAQLGDLALGLRAMEIVGTITEPRFQLVRGEASHLRGFVLAEVMSARDCCELFAKLGALTALRVSLRPRIRPGDRRCAGRGRYQSEGEAMHGSPAPCAYLALRRSYDLQHAQEFPRRNVAADSLSRAVATNSCNRNARQHEHLGARPCGDSSGDSFESA